MVPSTQPSSSTLPSVDALRWVRPLLRSLILALVLGCVTDANAANTPPAAPPKRIVSLAPSLTETVEALGAADALVAITRFCQLQNTNNKIQRFDRLDSPNLETLVDLQPDLILATPLTLQTALHQIRSVGLPLLLLEQQTLEGALEEMLSIGRALHRESAARSLIIKIKQQLEAVRKKSEKNRRIASLILYDWRALYSTNRSTFAGALLECAGGENLAGSLPSPWPRLPAEWLIAARPECILLSRPIGAADPAPEALATWRKDPLWKRLPAVQSGRVFSVTEDLLSQPGPRVGTAAETLHELLHRELSSPLKPVDSR